MNDGKTPFLGDRRVPLVRAMTKAVGSAYRAMIRPPRKMTIIDAAWRVMEKAYMKASAGGTLPANARQIMYAARPDILRLAEVEGFTDSYFTQNLLPDYVNAHPEECADWDVVFDARGHFVEPHTRHRVDLGTIAVRQYLGVRPEIGPAIEFYIDVMFPTRGPEHRYRDILFVEKEGFDPLLKQARIADKFDVAATSTKGMSVTALRELLDRWAARGVKRVFVLHDFDVTGFSILGTLTTDSRRYTFENKIEMVDLGLRLADVNALGLQSEPVTVKGDHDARAGTLREHGASRAEIDFLLGYDGQGTKRVELNAMPSDVFIDFLEKKLTEAGVAKVVPDDAVIEEHARRLYEQKLAAEALERAREGYAAQARAQVLPGDLRQQVEIMLKERPELSWDQALALALGY
jgi:hypothetical protein